MEGELGGIGPERAGTRFDEVNREIIRAWRFGWFAGEPQAFRSDMVDTKNKFAACYAKGGELHFNVRSLGRKWFDRGANEAVDQLLIHEFGHQFSRDHLSHEYHEALCRLAAALKRLAMEKPDEMQRFGA